MRVAPIRSAMAILGAALMVVLVAGAWCIAGRHGFSGRDESYFPLRPGWRWEYALHITTADGASRARYFLTNLQPFRIGGTVTMPRRTPAGETYFYVEDAGGVQRVAELMAGQALKTYAAPQTVLQYPLAAGRHWRANTRTAVLQVISHTEGKLYRVETPLTLNYVVDSTDDTVTVPAGRFVHCLRVRAQGKTVADLRRHLGVIEVRVTSTQWYAPGVGLVKAKRKEVAPFSTLPAGEYDMELAALRR